MEGEESLSVQNNEESCIISYSYLVAERGCELTTLDCLKAHRQLFPNDMNFGLSLFPLDLALMPPILHPCVQPISYLLSCTQRMGSMV